MVIYRWVREGHFGEGTEMCTRRACRQHWLSCYGTRAACGPVLFVTTAALTVSIFASCSFSRSFTVASAPSSFRTFSCSSRNASCSLREFVQQHRAYHFVVNALGLPIRIRCYQS